MSVRPSVRVVLVSINSQFMHSSLAPWCLKAGLAAYAHVPHEAQVAEGTVNEPAERVAARILALSPQVLGISCYIWNITYVETLLPLLRAALPDCAIVLGGPEVSYRAADVLDRCPQADFVLSGEGERPLAQLLDILGSAQPRDEQAKEALLARLPGLCFRTAHGAHVSAPFEHKAMPPSPYSAAYLKALDGRIAYLETSRGCPYACAFCLSGRAERLRQTPLERAFEEILLLGNSGAETVKFVDRTFNADRGRAREILAFIVSRHGRGIPEGVRFHFEIAGDLLDEATLALVETAPKGLFQFEIGLQSMDETTLRLVRRHTDMAHLQAQVSRLINCGRAHVHLDLIAGLPGETLPLFARGFDAAYRLNPHALQLGFLKLLHGSAMREQPDTYPCAFHPQPPYQVLSTPHMRADDFALLAFVERALDKLHNSGRFARTLRYLTGEGGQSPFDLFLLTGQAIREAEQRAGRQSLSLDELTDTVHDALAARMPAQAPLLKDLMLCDRLSSTQTAVLPRSLKGSGRAGYSVKRALNTRFPRQENTLRAVGILCAQGVEKVVWCDYLQRDPVTGLFPLNEMETASLTAALAR